MKKVTRKTKRKPKGQTLRSVLDGLDKILDRRDRLSQQLWDVLSALRGPDSHEPGLKHISTVPIRNAAFPRVAARGSLDTATFGGTKRFVAGKLDHFGNHAVKAAKALGLTN